MSREVEDRSEVKFWTVAAYEVDRMYGGPEEGGWWYDAGDLICKATTDNPARAELIAETWRSEEFPYTRKRYSVLGGEDYDVVIYENEEPPAFFPEHRPHYE